VVEGRIVRDNVYGSIEDDAIRRDFTLNALYYDVADRSVIDYVGGYEDVLARRLRTIGDAEARYREDPVRMLRAVRLAAKLGLKIDPGTAEPIPRLAATIGESAPARLFEELLKLFMSGHAGESFRALDAHGLLAVLFPPTFRALHQAADSADRRLVEAALESTDRRISENRPVTPAFLLAALLWPAAKRALSEVDPSAPDVAVAAERAVGRVVAEQTARIAVPKRFSLPMQEIWALQPRFLERRKRAVHRFLSHPRFRAAYDFLVLRGEGDPAARVHADWWTRAQSADTPELDRLIAVPLPAADAEGPAIGPARKRRRRRRRRGGGAAPESTSSAP
jgi:poly(A) polymerase